uniref:TCTP domain-containing protein n=1 Tax=Aegilops tauschii subsp. strangulata TaxID=200361 RepID=A0A452ZVD0_AEGTS
MELEEAVLWEVDGQWVVQEAFDSDIGANPSAEGGGDRQGCRWPSCEGG